MSHASPGQEAPEPAIITTSKVVSTGFDRILRAIHDGALLSGQHISDGQIAEQFGVSRTPVREALQRLREIGIVEASPGRFTRIAAVTPEQTGQAYAVWRALYGVLVDEVLPTVHERAYNLMSRDNARFLAAFSALDRLEIARANLDFFSRLPPESSNAALQRAITSVVHIVHLGSLRLPDLIDLAALSEAHTQLLEAVRTRDLDRGRAAMVLLGGIAVPREAAAVKPPSGEVSSDLSGVRGAGAP